MTKPVRIQLSRTKGWNLQATSLAINGLPGKSCARPSPFGNYAGRTRADFDADLAGMSNADRNTMFMRALELRGHNLACFCRLDQPCHVDTWLAMAKEGTPDA